VKHAAGKPFEGPRMFVGPPPLLNSRDATTDFSRSSSMSEVCIFFGTPLCSASEVSSRRNHPAFFFVRPSKHALSDIAPLASLFVFDRTFFCPPTLREPDGPYGPFAGSRQRLPPNSGLSEGGL